jgi:hypothetical protein
MSDLNQLPRKTRCPFDGGWCPVVATMPAEERVTILYTWCGYCQVLIADAYVRATGESATVACFGYDNVRQQYYPWNIDIGVDGYQWRGFVAEHLPKAEQFRTAIDHDQEPQIYPVDNPPKDG